MVLCVLLVMCGVVWCCCFVWCMCVVWHAENPSVCAFKTPVCTQKTPACSTHAGVFGVHTEACRIYTRKGLPPSLSFLLSLFFLSFLLFSLSLFSSLSNNLNDHSSSRLSLCTQGSDMPECQSACLSVHSLFGEHVRIMQESTVLA